MVVRVYLAFCALLAIAVPTESAQGAVIYVDVANNTHEHQGILSPQAYERQTKPRIQERQATNPQEELIAELHSVKTDALLLYTNYASRAGNELRVFLNNMTGFADNNIEKMKIKGINDTSNCWVKFEYQMKKTEHDARRAASYSGDSHHKFLLGHMIVFRMHINKSEDYLKKCDAMVRGCGLPCESNPRVKRWRRLAMEEIHRVRDDIQHTKKAYRDLVSHARRKLHHLKKNAFNKEKEITEKYYNCIKQEQ